MTLSAIEQNVKVAPIVVGTLEILLKTVQDCAKSRKQMKTDPSSQKRFLNIEQTPVHHLFFATHGNVTLRLDEAHVLPLFVHVPVGPPSSTSCGIGRCCDIVLLFVGLPLVFSFDPLRHHGLLTPKTNTAVSLPTVHSTQPDAM